MRLVAIVDAPNDAGLAFARSDDELTRALAEGDVAIAFYACALRGETLALGAFQRSPTNDGAATVRRRTGGITAFAGEGVSYMAMRLRHASVSMPCPPNRVLNRNVRGLLAGLSTSGVPAHYFGRDFVSVAHRPAVLSTWCRDENGTVDLEFFVSTSRSFDAREFVHDPDAYAAHFLGKAPITLAESWGTAPNIDDLTDRVARRGYAEKAGLDYERREPSSRSVEAAVTREPSTELHWSAPHAIPIGSVEAGVRIERGLIANAELAGDFMADATLNARLTAKLLGKTPSAENFVAAINDVFLREGLHVEGVASLEPVRDALLEAARDEEAAAQHSS